ncbi:MAG: aryl-sulfate sulfotransferase, partial [Planctomycetaceae bacterium]|nr:aryl-sulfate sulfotransferase [Planctomycetaceae bacterium]
MPNLSPVRLVAAATAAFIAVTSAPGADADAPPANPLAATQNGVSFHAAGVYEGYSLVAPMNSTSTYLVDMQGRIVREWKSEYTPALSAYLLEDGHLLRPAANRTGGGVGGPGAGGRIQEFDWDGNLVWDYVIDIEGVQPHHDICKLPSGNVLVVAHEHKTAAEAIAVGRKPESVTEQILPDCLLEIKPTGPTTGEVVWEWHAWDHLVQDTDKAFPGYGEVSEHPELVDINFGSREFDRMMADPQQLARLRSLGYVGGGNPQRPGPDPAPADGTNPPDRAAPDGDRPDAPPRDGRPADGGRPDGNGGPRGPMQGDWMHVNSVAYHAGLDQIVLSVHNFSEIWIIDHGTTTAEAASHAGGKRGHGGDLLYRWGNPQAYRNGSRSDQRLFAQHCAAWIPDGRSGAGHLMVFNNGQGRPDGSYSSVDEIELPLAADGTYEREEFLAYGPDRACWTFSAPDKSSFFSMLISGAQRLPNGNTFICSGNQAMLFEVTSTGEIVWVYKHPGGGMGFDGGRMGMFPDFVRRMLQVDDEQGTKLTALQADVDKQLAGILTDEQRQRMAQPFRPPFGGPPVGGGRPEGNPPADGSPPPEGGPGGDRRAAGGPERGGPGGRGPGGFRGFRPPRFGEVIPSFVVDSLELTDEQESQIAAVQKTVDARIPQILTDDQRTQV